MQSMCKLKYVILTACNQYSHLLTILSLKTLIDDRESHHLPEDQDISTRGRVPAQTEAVSPSSAHVGPDTWRLRPSPDTAGHQTEAMSSLSLMENKMGLVWFVIILFPL